MRLDRFLLGARNEWRACHWNALFVEGNRLAEAGA